MLVTSNMIQGEIREELEEGNGGMYVIIYHCIHV